MSGISEDDLSRRLRAADPVPSGRTDLPSGRSIERLVEDTMANATDEDTSTTRASRWPLLAAAAVVVAAATVGGVYLANRDSSDSGSSHSAKSAITLKLPKAASGRPGLPGGTCIRFSVDLLSQQDVAFSGTVESVDDATVSISVDHWYKGGSADEVDLALSQSPNAVNEFGVAFQNDHRYLVSATNGTVTGCGYTGEYSAELAADFAEAFGP